MKNTLLIALGVSLLSYSCVTVQKINLDGIALDDLVDTTSQNIAENTVLVNKLSKPALSYNQGKLNYDFKSTSESLSIENGDEVKITSTGGRKIIFSQEFSPLDFRGALAIKIKAKSVGGSSPELQLMLEDVNGYNTNTIKLAHTIDGGDAFQTYYFDLNGAYSQSYPEMRDVDAKSIVKLNLRLNKPFEGDVLIESIDVILSNEIIRQKKNVPVGKDGGLINDFSSAPEGTEVSKGIVYSSLDGKLQLDATTVGALYENVKFSIPVTSLATKQKLKAKLKLEGSTSAKVRIDLIDANGIITNKRPIIKEIKPGDWNTLVYDYSNRLAQSYPQQVDVDASRIAQVVIYINPGDNTFTGKLLIDELIVE